MSLLQRARASGRCPPSLLLDQNSDGSDDIFEAALNKVLDATDLSLSSDVRLVDDFKALLQMTEKVEELPGDLQGTKNSVFAQRRCIILAVVGSTPTNSTSLEYILSNGFLNTVKLWLDQILSGSVGGVDLMLHLLSNIIKLPVTKSIVKESGMGKAIGSLEKHKLFLGTPNEQNIRDRVQQIKEAWNKSVKALKDKDPSPSPAPKVASKRELSTMNTSLSPSSKKARVEETKKPSLSSLLKKVNPSSSVIPSKQEAGGARSLDSKDGLVSAADSSNAAKTGDSAKRATQKKLMRVKWADHFGGQLSIAKIMEGDSSPPEEDEAVDSAVSWSDRKRRDRLREKELLAQVKKAKLLDDDDDDGMGMETAAPSQIQPTTTWHMPHLLPERPDVSPAQLTSIEISVQNTRMATVAPVRYTSEYDVPSNPAPLSDVEQALDMTSQSSKVVSAMPFFVPQVPAPEPAITPAPAPSHSYGGHGINVPLANSLGFPISSQPQPGSAAASAETVQTLGLPMFLVGQNVQALQTLASTPSLLSTFVDSNGMYDQSRLMSLVQTLSQNIAPAQPQLVPMGHVGGMGGYPHGGASAYGPSGGQPQAYASGGGGGGIYGPASSYGPDPGAPDQRSFGAVGSMKNGYRGDQNNGDGNLHLSGYGPATTQADIISLFAPYVHVDEVVMKGTFCFVNTNDAIGAKRAREALTGAHLGGGPIRINIAQRKNRDAAPPSFNSNPVSAYGAASGMPPPSKGMRGDRGGGGPPPRTPQGQIDVDNIRDDRGNPATKNLFVAGYGPGTTETQVRQLFGLHANIIGIIMKGTFSFVNTSEKIGAIQCREALSGTMLNGGVLRINFAKETGRLGTSFDLTYGGTNPPPGGGGGGGSHSHYGR